MIGDDMFKPKNHTGLTSCECKYCKGSVKSPAEIMRELVHKNWSTK